MVVMVVSSCSKNMEAPKSVETTESSAYPVPEPVPTPAVIQPSPTPSQPSTDGSSPLPTR